MGKGCADLCCGGGGPQDRQDRRMCGGYWWTIESWGLCLWRNCMDEKEDDDDEARLTGQTTVSGAVPRLSLSDPARKSGDPIRERRRIIRIRIMHAGAYH